MTGEPFIVLYRPSARLQLFAIVDWIAHNSPQNAVLVLDRVTARVDSLCRMPRRFPRVQGVSKRTDERRFFVESSVRVEYVVGRSSVTVQLVRHAAMHTLE